VLEREVDHTIRPGSHAPQDVEIIESAPLHLRTGGGDGGG